MNRTFVKHLSLCLSLSMGFAMASTSLSAPAYAKTHTAVKKMTITDRIDKLSKEIEAGQKNNELTLDEATDLQKKISKINDKITKCKDNNGGQLSYKDQNSIEKDLNKVSVKRLQLQLSKRTDKPSH